mmetsp:Transcript_10985/g.1649  ORF Transcript_10985/g.1649 Transcript_10985/m.1649 type:complete len:105 (-) Transcript_10985:12-326(-)
MWMCFAFILHWVHPGPFALIIGILFIKTLRYTVSVLKDVSLPMRCLCITIISFNVLGLLCIPLDILCSNFLYYHSLWHLSIMMFCFTGAIILELLHNRKLLKLD